MAYAELGEIRLYYEDQGAGEPIVLLHGFTLDHRQWTPQVEYFSKQYRCIVLDEAGARAFGCADYRVRPGDARG